MLADDVTAYLQQQYGIEPHFGVGKLLPDSTVTFSMTTPANQGQGFEYQLSVNPKGTISDDIAARVGLGEGPHYASMLIRTIEGPPQGNRIIGGFISRGEKVQVGKIVFDPDNAPEVPRVYVIGSQGWGFVPAPYLKKEPPAPWTVVKNVLVDKTDFFMLPGDTKPITEREPGVVARVLDREGDWSYIEVPPGMADDPSKGWVENRHLTSFDPSLSKQGILDVGVMAYQDHPNDPNRHPDRDWGITDRKLQVYIWEVRDGYVRVSAVGGLDAWEYWPDH